MYLCIYEDPKPTVFATNLWIHGMYVCICIYIYICTFHESINTEGAKKCIHILRKEKSCIKIVILNTYR
jgi:hypothetical protein